MFVRHHCSNIAFTTTSADTSAEAYTTVYDNNCGTKCNNNDCSYLDNSTKCITKVSLFWAILVTAPNTFRAYLFFNPLCAHDVFERSTDRE